jgi:hypothetical protein
MCLKMVKPSDIDRIKSITKYLQNAITEHLFKNRYFHQKQ